MTLNYKGPEEGSWVTYPYALVGIQGNAGHRHDLVNITSQIGLLCKGTILPGGIHTDYVIFMANNLILSLKLFWCGHCAVHCRIVSRVGDM